MKRILFVDDESKILTGLCRSLRGFRDEWEMVFAEGGAAALEHCAAAPFDVLVSDARMPGIEGSDLLRTVMQLYPDTARLILSGQCSRTSVLKCVAVAHQFLSKPCESLTLKSTVHRVCTMREAFPNGTVRKAISRTQWLPIQENRYRELEAEFASPEASIGKVAATIAHDVGMTAKVLQLVSSGFFGSPQHVATPTQAVQLLGLETIRPLFALPATLPLCAAKHEENELLALNDHSFAVAQAARRIMATRTDNGILIGDAFMAGALHEVGALALAGRGDPSPGQVGFITNRQEPIGGTDAPGSPTRTCLDPGGYLAALWGLPDAVVQAITYHRAPSACADHDFGPLTAVHVANAILEPAMGLPDNRTSQLELDYLQGTGCADQLACWREICEACRPQGVLS